MDGKDKVQKKGNQYTKEQLMDFFSNISLPDGVTSNYIEKENYIEFNYDNTIYSVMIDGQNWEEIKQELNRQKENKLKERHRIKELENQDSLTKLYNKEYSRRIVEEFLSASGPNSNHALMIVDIDNFKFVNENLGYLFGDTVLVNIAEALNTIFYNTDIAGRIGGDEFLIFLKNVDSLDLLKEKAQEVYSVFQNTYTGENTDYSMSCSIGIGIYPRDGQDFMELFKKADAALMHTRQSRKDYYGFYHEIDDNSKYIDHNCYDKYRITKTRAYGSSNFDKEITAFAFDIMSRTKDVNSAINLLLNKVRAQFDCNHICILENSIDESIFNITYLSCKDNLKPQKDRMNKYISQIEDYNSRFDENGIYLVKNADDITDKNKKTILDSLGIKAMLQCAIFENGILKGCVSIHDCEKPRYWNQYEIDSLVTITKIISSYLLKMRASERASRQLYIIKHYDALTGLPSLYKFKKDVVQMLTDNPGKRYAIIYSDINGFKFINETLGYDEGDKILCDFASLLSSNGLKDSGICRVSEDYFLAAVPLTKSEEALKIMILSLNEQFNKKEKAKYPGYKFVVTSGVAFIDNATNITEAIDNANIARKSIKNASKTACKFFDDDMKMKMKREAEITNSMEQALRNGEFIVYLQPKVGLKDNKMVGAEALVRWRRKDGSLIQPSEFIPIFERNGFVVNLDFYIYEEVCKILREWIKNQVPVFPISVNVSRIHLNDENFVGELKKIVDYYDIPYHLLELELTESIFINSAEAAVTTMKKLREIGFGVSIDDFGAGYSSLNLLKNMETDVIKLDKEFFGQGNMEKEEQIIVSSIICMAKQLNMKVLSEGVETKKQSKFLKAVSCDMAQGYLYSKPIPVKDFENLMIRIQDNDYIL